MPKTSNTATKGSTKAAQSKATPTTKRVAASKGKGKKEVGKASAKPKNQIKKPDRIRVNSRANPLYEARAKNFGIGQQIQPKRDLTRFVRWPKYIRIQRQKRILTQRLKVPGTINQFNQTIDKNTSAALFALLNKYRPETKKQKHYRLLAEAKLIADAHKAASEKQKEALKTNPNAKLDVKLKSKVSRKPKVVKYGLKHVTALVESKKAKLVLIANDVDPLELVLWLPTLCKKKDVPYLIVKGKARLGEVVHKKTSAVCAITSVKRIHQKELENLIQKARDNYLSRYTETVRRTGGQIMGSKHLAKKAKLERLKISESKIH